MYLSNYCIFFYPNSRFADNLKNSRKACYMLLRSLKFFFLILIGTFFIQNVYSPIARSDHIHSLRKYTARPRLKCFEVNQCKKMCPDLHGTVFCAFFQPCLLVCTTKQDASDGQNKPLDFQVIRSVRSPVQILKYKTNLCSCAQPTSSLLQLLLCLLVRGHSLTTFTKFSHYLLPTYPCDRHCRRISLLL